MYTNAQSINNKKHEFLDRVAVYAPMLIGITESCTEGKTDSDINIDNYIPFRDDRSRGSLLYVHDSLNFTQCDVHSPYEASVWGILKLSKDERILVGVVYKSPNSDPENLSNLISLMEKAANWNGVDSKLIMGDFNFPGIDWEGLSINGRENSIPAKFLNVVCDNLLHQNIDFYTRYRQGQVPSLLDLVFTDDDQRIEGMESECPLGKSDHVVINWEYIVSTDTGNNSGHQDRRNYWKGNYTSINRDLEGVDWAMEFNNLSANDMWAKLRDRLLVSVENHVPMRNVTKAEPKHPWKTKKHRRKVKEKAKFFKRWEYTGRGRDYREYEKRNREMTSTFKASEAEYHKELFHSFKDNSKRFYGYMRKKSKVKTRVLSLKKQDGTETDNEQEVASELCRFFKSVYTEERGGALPEFDNRVEEDISISDIVISKEKIHKKLDCIKEDKSGGPDGLSPMLLNRCADNLSEPLVMIFRKSLDDGKLPDDWKKSEVCPIYKKKGKRKEPGNYRPVSLTSTICKLMESIIKEEVIRHMTINDLFTSDQHGFMKGKSCLTNLLESMEVWSKAIDEGNTVDIIYLDYQKAFDTVPLNRLMKKLHSYGIRGKIWHWINNFLNDRIMRVGVRGQYSEWAEVTSGVPQGSVLGPALFLIYVNDIPDSIDNTIKLFADDTKLSQVIEGDINTGLSMQRDLDKLSDWSDTWQLSFNIPKCKRMHAGKNPPKFQYSMSDNGVRKILKETHEEKDLGVMVTDDLTCRRQCVTAAQKATNVLRQIKNTFQAIDIDAFRIIYQTYVRPHLEYAVQVWSPHLRKHINLLENVQRRATKLVVGLKNKSYEERLGILNIPTLEERRFRGDLIETYKILSDKSFADKNLLFESNPNLRGHKYKLSKERFNANARKHFFSQRVINVWNSLDCNIVEADTVNLFKKRLDENWVKIWTTRQRELDIV